MKVLYIANIRLPTEKAHGIQIMKMCEAFANCGHEVELVVPWRFNNLKDSPFDYYSIPKIFLIKKIFSIDAIRFGRFGFLLQSFSYSVSVFFYTLFKKTDIIFGRDELPLVGVSFFKSVVWETHTGSYNLFTKILLSKRTPIIAITGGLKNFYIKKGVDPKRIVVSSDAVDLKQFDIDVSMNDARTKLGLPTSNKIALYTGHLYGWKGAHVLASAAKFLPEDVLVLFVGGTDKDIESFTKEFGETKNIRILGKKSHDLIPLYLKASNVLVLPNSPVNDISNLYTSPMKLFEYMASGRPIVASGLPSIKEILTSEQNALLVLPDNPKILAEAIEKILKDENLSDSLSRKSESDSKQYTWENRARTIVDFIIQKSA